MKRFDRYYLSTLKKDELIDLIIELHSKNEELEQESRDMEKEVKRFFARWEEDDKGVLRCTNCRTKAPKQKWWDKMEQVKTPYCNICGCRMTNGVQK